MDLSGFLLAWRTTALPDREVIDALVHPAHAGPSPALAAALRDWPGSHYWSDEPHGRHLVLTRPLGRRRDAWALHLLLLDRKSTRLNSSHSQISYAVFCLKKKNKSR